MASAWASASTVLLPIPNCGSNSHSSIMLHSVAHRNRNRNVYRFLLSHKKSIAAAALPTKDSSSPPSKDFSVLCPSSVFSKFHQLSCGTKGFESAITAVLLFLQISLPLPLGQWEPPFISSVNAVLYSPETKIPRTGELALRRAIPANTNMKAIQDSLEDISYLLRIPQRKPYGTMESNVKKAMKIAMEDKQSILASIPEEFKEKGLMLYSSLIDGKGGMQSLIEFIKEKDADKVSVGLSSSLDTLAELEQLQVVLDGYSAPLTAGNFAKLVINEAYNGVKLKSTDQAIISDNELENYGYSVPLEVMPSGQFEPLYKTALSIQDGELPVLPLSVYGSVAMAHNADSEEYSSPSQFFFYLYDKRNAGLGGLSFDEGHFSVFGYTTVGREILTQIKSGDLIRSAKLVEGVDKLIIPAADQLEPS